MTYNQFVAQVRPLLYTDADNPSPSIQEMIDQSIKGWAATMQGLIETYREGNADTLNHNELTTQCKASKGPLPAGCDLNEIVILVPKDDDEETCQLQVKYPTYYKWEMRHKLIEGHDGIECWAVSVSPDLTEFYVYPEIEEGQKVKVYWTGIKTDYGSEDDVPWGADAVDCCAAYVNARIAMTRDDKMQRAQAYMQAYEQGKRRVFLNEERRSKVKYGN